MSPGQRRAAMYAAFGAAVCGAAAAIVASQWSAWRGPEREARRSRTRAAVVLRGRLVVGTGELLRPRVNVLSGSGRLREPVGSDGRFVMELGGRGPWLVALSADGRARVLRTVEAGRRHVSFGDVPLTEGWAIAGRLRDSTGRPIGAASVQASVAGERVAWQTTSLADGSFRIDALPRSPASVRIEAPGFEAFEQTVISIEEADTADAGRDQRTSSANDAGARVASSRVHTVEWVMRRPARWVGRVVGANGEPASGVTVTIAANAVSPAGELRTGDDGTFRFSVTAGIYDLRATRGTQVADPVYAMQLDEGAESSSVLVLHDGATLEGEVVDGDGQPVAGARVVLTEGGLGNAPRGVALGLDGRFRFEGLLDLPHELAARADGYAAVSEVPWTPSAGPARLVLERAATLVGRVEDARGFPIARAEIEVVGTDSNGGHVAITRSTLVSLAEVMELRARAAQTRLVPAGQLGVTVGPVPPIPIDDGATDGGAGGSSDTSRDAGVAVPASGRDGTFVVEGLPPGRFRVIARREGLASGQSRLVTLRPGARVENVVVVLEEPGTIEGRVLDARGFPVEAVRVEAVADDELYGGTLLTERDGTFRFHPALGATMVVARADDGAVVRRSVDVPADETVTVELRLPEPGETRSGRVVDARGFPVAGAVIVELDRPSGVPAATPGEPTDADIREAPAGLATSREDGTFDIALAPGRAAVIDVDHRDHAPRRVRIEAASRDEIRVVLDPSATVTMTIESEDGRALAGALIVARPIEPADATDRIDERVEVRTTSRRDGTAQLGRVAPGTWMLSVSAEAHVTAERRIDVQARGAFGVDLDLASIVLGRAGRVRGVAVDARGEPVAGAVVAVGEVPRLVRARAVPDGVAVTDARGRFVLRGVAAGEHVVRVRHRGAGEGETTAVRVTAGETTDDVRVSLVATTSTEGADDDGASSAARVAISVEDREGRVTVSDVVPESAAAERGLRAGDVLIAVDGERVRDAEDARRRLGRFGRRAAELVVERAGRSFEVSVAREVVAW